MKKLRICFLLLILIGGTLIVYKKYMPNTNQQNNSRSENTSDLFSKPIVKNGITYLLFGKEEITRFYLLDGNEQTENTGYTIDLVATNKNGSTKWSTQIFWSKISSPEFLKTLITEFLVEGDFIKVSGPMFARMIDIKTGELQK